MTKRLILLLFIAVLPLAAVAAEPVGVVVSVAPEAYLVRRIADEKVNLMTLVQAGRNPADYEPTPSQMAALGSAKIWFRIGVPFEQRWMQRIRANNPTMQVVDVREGMELNKSGGNGHSHHEGMDPHIWTDPRRMQIAAQAIRNHLVQLDPEHRANCDQGYEALEKDLKQLDSEIGALLQPAKNRKFMVYHPSWGYFAERYHLQQISIEHEGKEPGPRHLLQLIDLGRREHIGAIFVQKQFDQSQAESLASAIGATIVMVDPLAADYIDNMRKTAQAFASALR